jgi:hypothetical protein
MPGAGTPRRSGDEAGPHIEDIGGPFGHVSAEGLQLRGRVLGDRPHRGLGVGVGQPFDRGLDERGVLGHEGRGLEHVMGIAGDGLGPLEQFGVHGCRGFADAGRFGLRVGGAGCSTGAVTGGGMTLAGATTRPGTTPMPEISEDIPIHFLSCLSHYGVSDSRGVSVRRYRFSRIRLVG